MQLRQWKALTRKHWRQFKQSKSGIAQLVLLFLSPVISLVLEIKQPDFPMIVCLMNSAVMVYRMCEERRLGLFHLMHRANVNYFVYLCSWLAFYAFGVCLSFLIWFGIGSIFSLGPFDRGVHFLPMFVTYSLAYISTFCVLLTVMPLSHLQPLWIGLFLFVASCIMITQFVEFSESVRDATAVGVGFAQFFNPIHHFRKILRRMEHVIYKFDYTMGDMCTPGSEMKYWFCSDPGILNENAWYRLEENNECAFINYVRDYGCKCKTLSETCVSEDCIASPISDLESVGYLVLQIILYLGASWYVFQILVFKKRLYFMFQKHQRRALQIDDYTLSITGLTKRYGGSNILALNNLNLTARSNEVLVLLGVNGAGKTSLCDILVGKQSPSSGDVLLASHPIHETGENIAYVNQFDVLFDVLTPKQHLELFCDLQGVQNVSETVRVKLDELHLTQEQDTHVHRLSGGTKRRVSLGLTLVSNPKLVFLDEPTTGIDPLNRRRVWNVIAALKLHRIVILTTHMMDEAEMLGDQVVILHKGTVEARGTPQELIASYGTGYMLRLTADPSFLQHISNQLSNHFKETTSKGLKIIDKSAGNLEIGLNETELIEVPKFLNAVESSAINSSMFIRDWSLTQSCLEEVFLCLVNKRKTAQSDDFQSPIENMNDQSLLVGQSTKEPQVPELGGILGQTDPSGKITSMQQIQALVQLFRKLNVTGLCFCFWLLIGIVCLIVKMVEDITERAYDYILIYLLIYMYAFFYLGGTVMLLVIQLIRDKKDKHLFLMSMNRLQLLNYYWAQYGYFMFYQVLYIFLLYFLIRDFLISIEWFEGSHFRLIMSCLSYSHAQFGIALMFGSYFSRPLVAEFVMLILWFATFFLSNYLSHHLYSLFPGILLGWIPIYGLILSIARLNNLHWFILQAALWIYGSLSIFFFSKTFSQRLHPRQARKKGPAARFPVISFVENSTQAPPGGPLEHEYQEVIQNPYHNGDGPAVVFDRVTKRFSSKVALNELSMNMNYNECFGVLGPNGAGKTTAMSMLVGEIAPTSGNVWVNKCNVETEWEKAVYDIGYVPQYDALYPSLTVAQHLYFYGRLQGIPEAGLGDWITYILRQLCMDDSVQKKVKHLSGGQKRRVSLAIAILSNPKVMLLDEPTTGLDPSIKRKVWDIIETLKTNRCIVITTHAMEEVEVLCTRMSILVNGSVRCTGTSSEIRNMYGRKLQLHLKVQDENRLEELNQLLEKMSPTYQLVTTYGTRWVFSLSRDGLNLLEVFHLIAQGKASGLYNEWRVGQVSLDETFCRIAAEAEGVERNI